MKKLELSYCRSLSRGSSSSSSSLLLFSPQQLASAVTAFSDTVTLFEKGLVKERKGKISGYGVKREIK